MLAPDDQRVRPAAVGPCSQQAAGDRRAVHKAGAGGIDIKHRDILRQAEFLLDQAGVAWRKVAPGDCGAQAAADFLGIKAAVFKRLARRADCHCAGIFPLGAETPLADAGAGGDPFVAGLHNLAQIVVGHNLGGQVGPGRNQLESFHVVPPLCHRFVISWPCTWRKN